MRFILLLSLFCSSLLAAERPNIILINIDDLGWSDLSYQSEGDFYESPNIDELAKEGIVFSNAYAGAANCAPSRACLLLGQWTPRHGVYTVQNSDRGKSKDRKLIPTKNTMTIPEGEPTLGDLLKSAGYHTASMGKWHVSKSPLKKGFDVNIGGTHAGGPYKGGYHSPFDYPSLTEKEKGTYLTDRLTTEAVKFITADRDKPFFLYLPYFTVHAPLQGKPELVEHFKQKKAKNKLGDQAHPVLAAMIKTLDENIGLIRKSLKDSKLADNTLIIFTSDNGGVYNASPQWPLRAGKGSYYEGGIREPFIMHWPAKFDKAATIDTPITQLDLYPTLASISGAKIPENKVYDGQSLLPLLSGDNNLKERSLYWHFPIYLQGGNKDCQNGDKKFRTRPGSAIRKGDWKLIQYFENNDLELFNLASDPSERTNLAQKEKAKTIELLADLQAWQKKTKAPIPTERNPDFKGD